MKLYHATTQKKAKLYRQSGNILSPVRGFTTMRCYVTSKLGEEVNVPKELV